MTMGSSSMSPPGGSRTSSLLVTSATEGMPDEEKGGGSGAEKTAGDERERESIELAWSLLLQILFAASAAYGGGEPSQLGDPFTMVPMAFSGWPSTSASS